MYTGIIGSMGDVDTYFKSGKRDKGRGTLSQVGGEEYSGAERSELAILISAHSYSWQGIMILPPPLFAESPSEVRECGFAASAESGCKALLTDGRYPDFGREWTLQPLPQSCPLHACDFCDRQPAG